MPARSPPSAAPADAPPRRPVSSTSCASRPKTCRNALSRRARPPRRPPSAPGAPRARSQTPIPHMPGGPTSSSWSGSSAGARAARAGARDRDPALRGPGQRAARRRRPPARAELGASLRRLGAEEVELRQAASAAGEQLAAVDVELARTDAERDEAKRRLEAAGVEPAEGEDRDELAEKLARYEKRREQLGQVNPLAKEEYDAEKERLEELSVQRADLEKSLDELEKLRDELTTTVETRFAETFTAVEKHFHEVAATLFPGGEGRLRLTEPEDDDEEPGHRGRAAPGRQARDAAVAPLRRREGARRDRVPVLALPRAPEPVLSPRRGRGRARRHEHRPLHRAAAHATPIARSSS